MPKYRALSTSAPESIEQAWADGDELGMARAIVRKYARVLDMTDSGRDIKPLATGLLEAVAYVKALEATEGLENDTPYARIMREAEAALANA